MSSELPQFDAKVRAGECTCATNKLTVQHTTSTTDCSGEFTQRPRISEESSNGARQAEYSGSGQDRYRPQKRNDRSGSMLYKLNKSKFEARKQLPNTWQTSLSYSFCAAPFYCCFTVLCPFCAAYQQRERALFGNWSNYLCCAGMMPCSGRMGERNCPQFCLLLEVCCCFSVAVQTTRALIQDELQLRNARCDNFIIGCMVMLQYFDCICDIMAMMLDVEEISTASVVLDQISQWCYCLVCSCLQTQQYVELNTRDAIFGVETAPNVQYMTRN